jgi:hypothetical protein
MRTKIFSILGISILSVFLTTQTATASEDDASQESTVRPAEAAGSSPPVEAAGPAPTAPESTAPRLNASVPVYVPPRRGQPRARVGGGVRGSTTELPSVRALVPDHLAHTARSQPTLLWYLDRLPAGSATLTFRFNLTNDEEIDPLIAVELEIPTQPGLQRIDLANYEFSLETGQEYQWSVALVTDSEHRVRDIVTLGWIERVEEIEDSDTSGAEAKASTQADTASLAAAGLWYDAVDAANQTERAALLDQIGLAEAE